MKNLSRISLALAAAASALGFTPASATTLEDVKAKGFLQCGVNIAVIGFSAPTASGDWAGIDIDYCKAVAAAIFGDATKVKYTPLNSTERFTALQSGEIDLLSRNATWTIGRDTSLGLNFRPITYYDGLGFMAHKELGVTTAAELAGASICFQTGTTVELTVADFFRGRNLEYKPLVFARSEELIQAYEAGRCDAMSTDRSELYSRLLDLKDPSQHVILPDVISKEPLSLTVRQGDDQWLDIVSWTHYALLNAEEYGITQANVDEMLKSTKPEVMRILGTEPESKIGTDLGLTKDWAYNIVKAVGNYGEVFERNLGQGSPMKIERGLNALWSNGGLQYAPPIR